MLSKELKRLSRHELVEIIYQLKKNEEEKQEEIESLKKELQEKRIRISVAGSIADAAISVTNVFSVAQMAADLYLREIEYMKEETEKECAQKIEAAETKAKEILAECEKKIANIEVDHKSECINWQQLQSEISVVEENKKHELCEEVENG